MDAEKAMKGLANYPPKIFILMKISMSLNMESIIMISSNSQLNFLMDDLIDTVALEQCVVNLNQHQFFQLLLEARL